RHAGAALRLRRPVMDENEKVRLEHLALNVRERVLDLATNGGCFLGASLSCTDLLVFLYARWLRYPAPADPEPDLVFLSKGHHVPALYATLVELGHLDPSRLDRHLEPDSGVYWHPNRSVPGVEFHSGSLGRLPSVAIGVACDLKLRGSRRRVVVVLGDGELDEGSVWEAFLVAAAWKLDNLWFLVDRNGFQANERTERLTPLEPLREKLEAFGMHVSEAEGHDFTSLDLAFAEGSRPGQPRAIVARTIRGRGIPSIEGRADRWFCNFRSDEIERLR